MDIPKKREGFEGQKAIVIPRKILANQCAKNNIISTLYITDIGYYPKAKFHYRERPHGADQHILIYCYEGSGRVSIRKSDYAIQPGDFFIVPMKMAHTYAADEKNPWTIYWIHFKGSISASIISLIQKQNDSYKGFIQYNQISINLFNEMYSQMERGYSSVNLSPSHFSYLFKKKTGFPPIEYFNHLKVQKACQYLLFTNLRIKEIALEIGISDSYYFSRMFTKVMGVPPTTYKEKRIH